VAVFTGRDSTTVRAVPTACQSPAAIRVAPISSDETEIEAAMSDDEGVPCVSLSCHRCFVFL
jgi:hypothetical protein